MTEELATQEQAGPPALRYNPAQELTSEDIPVPRVKFAQGLSSVVTDGLVPYGAIYKTLGRDDPQPEILVDPAKANGETGEGVRFYVYSVKKGYSFKNAAGDLDNTRDGTYPDLSLVKNNDPKEVYRTFDFTIAIPEHDQMLPHKLMLYRRWGASAAKRINLALLQAQAADKDPSSVAFTLKAKKDKNDYGSFATAIVDVADVPAVEAQKDAEIVEKLRSFVGNSQSTPQPSRPAIEAPALD